MIGHRLVSSLVNFSGLSSTLIPSSHYGTGTRDSVSHSVMYRFTLFFIFAVLIVGIEACSTTDIRWEPDASNLSPQERIGLADVIVVGRATSVETFDPDRTHPEAGLTKVNIAVENVLKGNSTDQELPFYFYRIVGGFNGPKPNFVRVGDRGIFFLKRDQDILRSVHDIWESHIKVYSGRHDAITVDRDVQETIARVVITPGDGFDPSEYPRSLPESVTYLGVPLRYSVPLLETLVDGPEPDTAKYACLALSDIFVWGDECLDSIARAEGDADVRTKAAELAERNLKSRQRDEQELKLGPAIFFSRISYGGVREGRFILERLAKHPDPEVRNKASELLRQINAVGY
jgi:hypothetical protein